MISRSVSIESVPPLSIVYHKSEFRVRTKRKQGAAIDFSI